MDTIIISELEVYYSVGVTDEERQTPQRLLITMEMISDLAKASVSDDIDHTVNYFEVSQRVLRFGEGRSWKLIERLASDLADVILREFGPRSVFVEVKKFVIPQARFVAVRLSRLKSE